MNTDRLTRCGPSAVRSVPPFLEVPGPSAASGRGVGAWCVHSTWKLCGSESLIGNRSQKLQKQCVMEQVCLRRRTCGVLFPDFHPRRAQEGAMKAVLGGVNVLPGSVGASLSFTTTGPYRRRVPCRIRCRPASMRLSKRVASPSADRASQGLDIPETLQ